MRSFTWSEFGLHTIHGQEERGGEGGGGGYTTSFFWKRFISKNFSSYEKDTIRLKFYGKTFQCTPFPILEDLFEEEQKVLSWLKKNTFMSFYIKSKIFSSSPIWFHLCLWLLKIGDLVIIVVVVPMLQCKYTFFPVILYLTR